MNLGLLIGVACAILFHRAAYYEHMSPWAWTLASVGLTVLVSMAGGGTTLMLLAQAGLFVAMWLYNASRQGRKRG